MNSIVIAPDITYLKYIINKSLSYNKIFVRSLKLSSFFYSCFIHSIYIQECDNKVWYEFALQAARRYHHPLIRQSLDRPLAVAVLPNPYVYTKFDSTVNRLKKIFETKDILESASILGSLHLDLNTLLSEDVVKVALFSKDDFSLLFEDYL